MRPSSRCLSSLRVGSVREDFSYMQEGIAFLNHGSFGASPKPVLDRQEEFKMRWQRYPDSIYFSGRLEDDHNAASSAVASKIHALAEEVCLMSNATDATGTIAARWGSKFRASGSRGNVLLLDICYKANKYIMNHHCQNSEADVVFANIPFPYTSNDDVLAAVDAALEKHKPRFVLLEPAMVLPLREMVALCRQHGVEEVAVDGAHSFGSIPDLDVPSYGADFFYSNIHKWGFAPHTCTLVWCTPEVMSSTSHPIISWNWQKGLKQECIFPGTRDFSAILAAPAAIEYLSTWRAAEHATCVESMHGGDSDSASASASALGNNTGSTDTVEAYNRAGLLAATSMLQDAWGTAPSQPLSSVACMAMVQLPPALAMTDVPGVPTAGVRSTLRERYGIEAALGNFGPRGNFVRLSHAVYNSRSDFERLRDAVLELLNEQEQEQD